MPEITVVGEFEVWCANCGAGICGNFRERTRRPGVFDADPCEKCLENAREEGSATGFHERQTEVDQLQEQVRRLEKEISEATKQEAP